MSEAREFLDRVSERASRATEGPWSFAYSAVSATAKYRAWEELDCPEPHTGERKGKCAGCPDRRQGCSFWRQFEDLDPVVASVAPSYGDTATGQRVKDAEFIAASRSDVPDLVAFARSVLDLADRWEHGATRWADPLPVPPEVEQIRALADLHLTTKEGDR